MTPAIRDRSILSRALRAPHFDWPGCPHLAWKAGQRLLFYDRPHLLCANSTKLFEGGWFPLVLAGAVAFVMLTWRSGAKLVEGARRNLRQPEADLIETATSGCQARLPGTAVFLASAANGVPLALTQFIRHNHVMHERIILLTVVIEETPRITDEGRVDVKPFTWTADPDKIIRAVRRGHQVLDSIH